MRETEEEKEREREIYNQIRKDVSERGTSFLKLMSDWQIKATELRSVI